MVHFGGCEQVRKEAILDVPFWIFFSEKVRQELYKCHFDMFALKVLKESVIVLEFH